MSLGDPTARASGPYLLPHGNFVVLFTTTAPTTTGGGHPPALEAQVAKFDPGTHAFQWRSTRPRWLAPLQTRTLTVLSCGRSTVGGTVRPCVLLQVSPAIANDDDDEVDKMDDGEIRTSARISRSYLVLSLETGRRGAHPDHFVTRLGFESRSGPRGTDVALVGGCAVVWWRGGQIYVATNTASVIGTRGLVGSSATVQTYDMPGMDVFWVGEFYGQLAAVGRASDGRVGDRLPSAEWIAVPLRKTSSLTPSLAVPHEYAAIARCLWTSDRCRDGFAVTVGDDVNDGHGDDEKAAVVVVATSAGQLLEFAGGGGTAAPRLCALPFGDAARISEMPGGCCGDGALLVRSEGGDACAVWRDTFQVAARWEAVRDMLVGDFAGTGCDQALLLHGDSDATNPLREFTITDLGPVAYTSVEGAEGATDGAMEEEASLEKRRQMVRVLETRLQAGLCELRELQLLSQEKRRVIGRAAAAVASIPGGVPSPGLTAVPPGLVPMFDDEVGSEDQVLEDVLQEPTVTPPVTVKRIWQRVIDDSWVVGVDLEWTNERRPRDLRLLLLDEPASPGCPRSVVSSRCAPLHPDDAVSSPRRPSPTWQPGARSPPAKRNRLPSDRVDDGGASVGSAVAVTTLPVFAGGETGDRTGGTARRLLLLVLDADGGGGSDHDDGAGRSGAMCRAGEGGEAGDATGWECGAVTLSASDVSGGKLAPRIFERDDLEEGEAWLDVQALSAARPWGSLLLRSRDVTLGGCLSALVSALGRTIPAAVAPSVAAAAVARPLVVLSQRRHGPLTDTAVVWRQEGPFDARLEFVARSSASLCALMAAVKASLPRGAELRAPDPRAALGVALSRCLDAEITAALAHARLTLGSPLPPETRADGAARDPGRERAAFAREAERRRAGAPGTGASDAPPERLTAGRRKAAAAREATDAVATRLAAEMGRGAARWEC